MLGRNFLNRSAFLMLLLFPMFPMFPVFIITIDACVSCFVFCFSLRVLCLSKRYVYPKKHREHREQREQVKVIISNDE